MSVCCALQQGDNGVELNLQYHLVLRGGSWSASYLNPINTRQSFCGGNGSGWAPEPVSKRTGWGVYRCETPSCAGGSFLVS